MINVYIDLSFNEENGRWEAIAHFNIPSSGKPKARYVLSSQKRERVIASVKAEAYVSKLSKWLKTQDFSVRVSEDFGGDNFSVKSFAGLQMGQSSQDELARAADGDTRKIVPRVWKKICKSHPHLTQGFSHHHKMTADAVKQITGFTLNGGCSPDGGIIFNKQGLPVLAFEAKKQGDAGNAYDRWYKNFHHLKCINPNLLMVTFIVGLGAGYHSDGSPRGMLGGALNAMRLEAYKAGINIEPKMNVFNLGVPSFFASVEGFAPSEMEEIVYQCILKFLTI